VKVLGVGVPIFTSDFEAAISRYGALTSQAVSQRFEVPERGIRIAILGTLTIIEGTTGDTGALRDVRATFVVDSLAEFEGHLLATGGTMLQRPSRSPAGLNMIVRDVEGVVLEFVEPHPKE
jgi:hypothetical protein